MRLAMVSGCLLYTSDAADERSSVDLGGRRIIKKKKKSRVTRTSNDTERQQQDIVMKERLNDESDEKYN